MNAIDLFCGAGGFSYGFQEAGFNVLLGIDNNQDALNTFELNHKNAKGINVDLSQKETLPNLKKIINSQPVDIIIAGPPCQGFSVAGPRNFHDPRNKLYLAVMEAINFFKPKAFIIENVPGMASMYKGQVKEDILSYHSDYEVACKILKACDYGVPQMRKRLIFMGIRSDIGIPEFPEPTCQKYITCREAISDLPTRINSIGTEKDVYDKPPVTTYQKIMRGTSDILYNHVATKHKDFVVETISQVPEGGNYKDLPSGVGENRKFHMAWTRLDGNSPARTVDTGHRNIFHYELNRVPTVRENARLQSFPDSFIFTGSKTRQGYQVGNAVPPLLGKVLGEKILSIIGD